MINYKPSQKPNLFIAGFKGLLDEKNELYILANVIPWQELEEIVKPLYHPKKGRHSIPVRVVLGLLILKYYKNYSDEEVTELLKRDVYVQYLCGFETFVTGDILDRSTFTKFRRRLEEKELEEMFLVVVRRCLGEMNIEMEEKRQKRGRRKRCKLSGKNAGVVEQEKEEKREKKEKDKGGNVESLRNKMKEGNSYSGGLDADFAAMQQGEVANRNNQEGIENTKKEEDGNRINDGTKTGTERGLLSDATTSKPDEACIEQATSTIKDTASTALDKPVLKAVDKILLVDTTVQEKNITYPTDMKLYLKVLSYCRDIAEQENISLKQSYVRVEKKLKDQIRYNRNNWEEKEKGIKKLKRIASKLYKEVVKRLEEKGQTEKHREMLEILKRVIEQKKEDKDKIYSIHEPEVKCISKGKEHKRYEYGNKVCIVRGLESGIVYYMKSYRNEYDGHLLEKILDSMKERGLLEGVEEILVDRGMKGLKERYGIKIKMASNGNGKSKEEQEEERQKFRKRGGIEGTISELKRGHRLGKNYLKGVKGDITNSYMSGIARNLKWLVKRIKVRGKNFFVIILWLLQRSKKSYFIIFLPSKTKMLFSQLTN